MIILKLETEIVSNPKHKYGVQWKVTQLYNLQWMYLQQQEYK